MCQSIYCDRIDEDTKGELVIELDEDMAERYEEMRKSVNRDCNSDLDKDEFMGWVMEQAGRFAFP